MSFIGGEAHGLLITSAKNVEENFKACTMTGINVLYAANCLEVDEEIFGHLRSRELARFFCYLLFTFRSGCQARIFQSRFSVKQMNGERAVAFSQNNSCDGLLGMVCSRCTVFTTRTIIVRSELLALILMAGYFVLHFDAG